MKTRSQPEIPGDHERLLDIAHRTHNHRATAIWHRLPAEDKEAA